MKPRTARFWAPGREFARRPHAVASHGRLEAHCRFMRIKQPRSRQVECSPIFTFEREASKRAALVQASRCWSADPSNRGIDATAAPMINCSSRQQTRRFAVRSLTCAEDRAQLTREARRWMRMKRAWRCRAANAASRAPGARRLRRGGEVPVIDPDDLADKLSMPTISLYTWIRRGWVRSRQIDGTHRPWAIWADAQELARLRALRQAPKRGWRAQSSLPIARA